MSHTPIVHRFVRGVCTKCGFGSLDHADGESIDTCVVSEVAYQQYESKGFYERWNEELMEDSAGEFHDSFLD